MNTVSGSKPEQALWHWLRGRMTGGVFLERVENRVNVGTPDVYIAARELSGGGWIELKVLKQRLWSLPEVITEGPVITGENTCGSVVVRPAQVSWHERHAATGGRSWFMVEAPGRSILVAPGAMVARVRDGLTGDEMLSSCALLTRKSTSAEILAALARV